MKSIREWAEENNLNEFFGMFGKPKAQEPAAQPRPVDPTEGKAFCPFCNAWSAVVDDAYYPKGLWVWHCNKCKRDWDKKIIDRQQRENEYEPGRGAPGVFLPKHGVLRNSSNEATSSPGLKESLYLAGLISEEAYYEPQATNQQQPPDIEKVASQLQFQPTSKKKLVYQPAQDFNNMPAMSYLVAQQQTPVTTTTSDGKETQNTAEPNDVIISGPSREQYVVKAAKFPKLYIGQLGGPIHPEQSPRNVALYTGKQPITFTASWGESMVLKPGDYLVREGEGKYYRIAKHEYEMTYNPPGKVG